MMNTKTDTQGSSSPLSNMNELLDEWLQVQSNNMKLESDDVFYNVSNDRTTSLYVLYVMWQVGVVISQHQNELQVKGGKYTIG